MITQIGRWAADDRTFPYVLGALVAAATVVGSGLGFAVAFAVDRWRPRWPDPIAWEGVDDAR